MLSAQSTPVVRATLPAAEASLPAVAERFYRRLFDEHPALRRDLVSLPSGDLALRDADTPLLLASAGIGVTPMLSMLDHLTLASSTRHIHVVHADRTPAHHIHRQEQAELVSRLKNASLHLWYENDALALTETQASEGTVTLDRLPLQSDTDAYLCGPLPFMRALRADLLNAGLSPCAIHYEVFGPDLWQSR